MQGKSRLEEPDIVTGSASIHDSIVMEGWAGRRLSKPRKPDQQYQPNPLAQSSYQPANPQLMGTPTDLVRLGSHLTSPDWHSRRAFSEGVPSPWPCRGVWDERGYRSEAIGYSGTE